MTGTCFWPKTSEIHCIWTIFFHICRMGSILTQGENSDIAFSLAVVSQSNGEINFGRRAAASPSSRHVASCSRRQHSLGDTPNTFPFSKRQATRKLKTWCKTTLRHCKNVIRNFNKLTTTFSQQRAELILALRLR